jgi:hypothetical protein
MTNNIHFLSSRSILLRLINVSDEVVEKIEANILGSITFFLFKNRVVYEVMWKNILQPERL